MDKKSGLERSPASTEQQTSKFFDAARLIERSALNPSIYTLEVGEQRRGWNLGREDLLRIFPPKFEIVCCRRVHGFWGHRWGDAGYGRTLGGNAAAYPIRPPVSVCGHVVGKDIQILVCEGSLYQYLSYY